MQARRAAGLSQLQLAVAMGDRYDRSMIGHVEHNRSNLLLEGAAKAARTLRVSLDYLAGLVDNPAPVDALLLELDAYRESRGDGLSPLDVGRLLLSLRAADGALERANRKMDYAEKADFVLMIYLLDESGLVDVGVAQQLLAER